MIISKKHLDKMFEHAKREYPKECCGIVAGKRNGKKITGVYECENKSKISDEYIIDPGDIFKIDKTQKTGTEIIGFYHSHINFPPIPSPKTDRDKEMAKAWPEYSFIIISMQKDSKPEIRSWVWKERFEEEKIEVV